ncbi:hypothetical protein ACFQ7W_20445 [Streptomyces niveus]|uniref:hypothetical protein n=1 Tax=Streptomyces niveus TaxID=193462 RepID=UPI0036935C41
MQTRLITALGATVITASALLTSPAAAAEAQAVSVSFRVANGNTWTDGTITFYNRSVTVTGTHKSVSNASLATYRNTGAYTLNSERHQISSGVSSLNDEARGSTEAFTFSVGADVPGGAAVVRICLDDGYYEDLTCDLYGRPS